MRRKPEQDGQGDRSLNSQQNMTLLSGSCHLRVSQSTGKITSLKRGNEELLVQAHEHELAAALTDDGRTAFESLDAWGADECFPTIGRSALWNLRDHGELWASTPSVFYATADQCFTGWEKDGCQFKRTISSCAIPQERRALGAFLTQLNFPSAFGIRLQDGTQRHDLRVASTYASHALFAAEPGDRVEWSMLPKVDNLQSALLHQAPYHVLGSRIFADDEENIASKFYLRTPATLVFVTSLIRRRLRLRIDVIQDSSLPWVGIWWCHNGWGDGRPHSTVGIEPTNTPSDGPVLEFAELAPPSLCNPQFLWVISEY
jgi:hypothetical protein